MEKGKLKRTVNRPPSLHHKALTTSDERQGTRPTKTPKRQAVGSNPAGCATLPPHTVLVVFDLHRILYILPQKGDQ